MMMNMMRLARRPASYFPSLAILSILPACAPPQVPVVINFGASWNAQPIQCAENGLSLSDLRLYISDVILIDADGREHALNLAPDERWQQRNVALLDLEDGEGSCSNGTPDTNAMVHGTAAAAEFAGVRFTVGVPFELNHDNPLLADPPLDDAAMHWHWRSGYKFFRAGVVNDNDSFWIHLGSTGCEGTVQNISRCNSPNRVSVELADFSPDKDRISIELSALFRGVDLDDGVRSDCSSGPAETACQEPFAALGLDDKLVQTQAVFRVANGN